MRAPRAQVRMLPARAAGMHRVIRAHAASSATEAAPKRPGEKKGDASTISSMGSFLQDSRLPSCGRPEKVPLMH